MIREKKIANVGVFTKRSFFVFLPPLCLIRANKEKGTAFIYFFFEIAIN